MSTLGALAGRWMEMECKVRSYRILNTDSKSPEIGAGLLAGLKFILHSAAYQTLGSRRVMRRSDDDQIFMSTDALSKVDPKKLWLLVENRLSSLKARSVKIPPVSRLEKETRARYNLVPDSKSTSVRNFVTEQHLGHMPTTPLLDRSVQSHGGSPTPSCKINSSEPALKYIARFRHDRRRYDQTRSSLFY